MLTPPWSTNQLRKLSKHIRDGTEPPAGLPLYRDVMLWFNDAAASVQASINGLDWSSLLDDRPIEVTSRPKTLDTLKQKLQRDPTTPLPNVQDVAGVRFEAEMSLDQQDAVATAIAGLYDHDQTCIKDLRTNSHSGYRAVHLWLRLPARVEVQVRTHLQGAWANVYEAAADVIGRDIRYGAMPDVPAERDVVEALQGLSTITFARFEETRNLRERELLRFRGDGPGGTPVFDQQVQIRLESEWASQRQTELEFVDQLQGMQEQFRQMRREVN